MFAPAGRRISSPGKRGSVITCSVAALAIGTNLSSVGGGLMVQSGTTVTWFATIVVVYGQIGYSGFAGVASKRNVSWPAGRPTSVKFPAASVVVCGCGLCAASARTITPATPTPAGVTKRPFRPVTAVEFSTLIVTAAERVRSAPD